VNWIIRLPTKSRNTWKIGYWGSLYVEGKLKRRIGGNIKNWDAGKIISGRLFRESRLAGRAPQAVLCRCTFRSIKYPD
jgi:hypothetical protein